MTIETSVDNSIDSGSDRRNSRRVHLASTIVNLFPLTDW